MGKNLEDFYQCLNECCARGELERVEGFLLRRVERGQAGELEADELIAACNELGALYRDTGRYERSMAAFEQAKALAADGPDQGGYATILNNMAGTCRLMKDHARAIDLFLEALEICRRNGEQDSPAYAGLLQNLSLAYQETKQYQKAIQCLERALELVQALPAYRQEAAVTYNNLTALYHAAGEDGRAMECVDRALQSYEQCPEEERFHYTAVLNSLAGFLFAQGNCLRALTLYQKSAKHTRRFLGENEEYAVTCQNMRWVYEKMGERGQAAQCLDRAQRVYERLLGAEHERTRAVADDARRLREERGA